MILADGKTSESTYRAIGRFMFEFSQAEYAIRHYLGEEIGIAEEHFDAIIGSYDTALLGTVTRSVFAKTRSKKNAAVIDRLMNKFLSLVHDRNRVAHGLWVPFKDGGTVHHVARSNPKSKLSDNQAATLDKLADETCLLRADLERAFTSLNTGE